MTAGTSVLTLRFFGWQANAGRDTAMMFEFLEKILARLQLPPRAGGRRPLQHAAAAAADTPSRDDFGYHDPQLGDLKEDYNFICWRGRMVLESGDDCDLTLLDREEDGFPDSDPRPSGLERLREVQRIMESDLMARAIQAVIAARMERLNWRDGPAQDEWGPIEALVDRDDGLWLSIYEGVTDEYSLWIVKFDAENQPVEVLRTPFVASQAPAFERARLV